MSDLPNLREEIKEVLRLHPHTFIYFAEPVTREGKGGRPRDMAIGVYNFMLDVYVFLMNDRGRSFGTLYACYGTLHGGYWHAFREDVDIEFCQLFTEQLKQVRFAFAELMHMEANDVDG